MPVSDALKPRPFADFLGRRTGDNPLRARINVAHRLPEPDCVPPLIAAATLPPATAAAVRALTIKTVTAMRAQKRRGGVDSLVQEYALSSQEGVALMCLAEALLRTPDNGTRDALIADKIAPGDWQSHLGGSRSLFVNAATWGLVVTGKLVSPVDETGLGNALSRLVARSGEPVIRAGVNLAMKLMGEQFVSGQTIGEALKNGRPLEAKGFRYSYDMLGEAATTARDAERYLQDYRTAIHAIGKAAAGRGVYEGPGISIKLSALHPRYGRSQYSRVIGELLPRVIELALLAKSYDIGLNIDAEEADRLDISLDILEALCAVPQLAGWQGIGFVVQAYSKRCPSVLDFLIDLARRSGHRIMVRLVKGAYWDSEIKRAQLDGLDGFPVYTRKVYTDVAYIACAQKLLAATDAVYPQFATHNAQTMATIYQLAGAYTPGQYEFQCLHGMGEPLYEEVVGKGKLDRPCRIYAPVGSHETLLAYLVRRLLENGANSSFVNRIADPEVPVTALADDPAAVAGAIVPVGAPHPAIDLPRDILAGTRANSRGLDLSNEPQLQRLAIALGESVDVQWQAEPMPGAGRQILNPADHRDVVGTVVEPSPDNAARALNVAKTAAPAWAATAPSERAAYLRRAADAMEARIERLMGLIIREAGKSAANAISEVREAVDFLRYHADQAESLDVGHVPLGPVVCISPWNFPLAIFTGQVAAALVAGNPVIAKPAEETPLIAAQAIELLHQAGVPRDVLQFLPGDGRMGAALVGDPGTCGVMFTGSTDVARLIARQLAERTLSDGRPVPFVAETGGQNALIVDSSALTEQVVGDVLASAFDSAGQRCSALRVLCLQEDIADKTLAMLKGAMAELRTGNPDRLATDIGPVITAEAQKIIADHVAALRAKGRTIVEAPLDPATALGTFVAPTLIELQELSELTREVFGPVLHVVRYRREDIDALVDRINALGYGLTFGLHTRIDTTIERVTSRISAGNIYVNRNQIGAVVGVQPFGGHGLSGTGPKAGGPLYLRRLVRGEAGGIAGLAPNALIDLALSALTDWLAANGRVGLAQQALGYGTHPAINASVELAGPVGERNVYGTAPRGTVLAIAASEDGLLLQLAAILATGNSATIEASPALWALVDQLPPIVGGRVARKSAGDGGVAAVLVEGDAAAVRAVSRRVTDWPGPIITVQSAPLGQGGYSLDLLVTETAISTNTAAAGGNASLMAIA
ncbi:MAG: proline dehydrogenase (proline oxidase) / delta-pyrroline-5-carboxylate dehydrogenase [Devosia sp.]|uniref:trifunctional transcriptional regulator/proline dehydrogenase/L-glutamate gamma-semialdehyde dehydrogenase n=1 Tax=Devosia sp. TaxID=1871048 RepID=UPI002639AC54|nr:trifunctional transcriptional regulator/proline dehydrogenase/L-glutamate gamma-semialdehyde dehydrogenase [Devosia sp.]MDB5528328.1 proline dehydrogenase (proline oxidase) / delta-pyrroline-5-carboxylate dehydrogenase [Devosia sp.]